MHSPANKEIVVVMPAYNAANTLAKTWNDLPKDIVSEVILVDDCSRDDTIKLSKELGIKTFYHHHNFGYGANQKTCYAEALKTNASIIVMVHPDYQYDPRLLPDIIQPILEGKADVVFGSRMMSAPAYKQGMPWWKYLANKFLTGLENVVFGLSLSEFHTGYRAYHREVLEKVNFRANSDSFIFDQEIVAQIVDAGFRFREVAVPVRYFPEASSTNFRVSVQYGFAILWLLFRYILHRASIWRSMQFVALGLRYHEV